MFGIFKNLFQEEEKQERYQLNNSITLCLKFTYNRDEFNLNNIDLDLALEQISRVNFFAERNSNHNIDVSEFGFNVITNGYYYLSSDLLKRFTSFPDLYSLIFKILNFIENSIDISKDDIVQTKSREEAVKVINFFFFLVHKGIPLQEIFNDEYKKFCSYLIVLNQYEKGQVVDYVSGVAVEYHVFENYLIGVKKGSFPDGFTPEHARNGYHLSSGKPLPFVYFQKGWPKNGN